MGLGRLWSLPKTILNGTRPLVSGNDQTEVAHYALLPLNIWNSRLNVNAYANKLSSTRNEIALSRSAAWVIEKPMKQYHKYYIKYNNIPFYRNNIFFVLGTFIPCGTLKDRIDWFTEFNTVDLYSRPMKHTSLFMTRPVTYGGCSILRLYKI